MMDHHSTNIKNTLRNRQQHHTATSKRCKTNTSDTNMKTRTHKKHKTHHHESRKKKHKNALKNADHALTFSDQDQDRDDLDHDDDDLDHDDDLDDEIALDAPDSDASGDVDRTFKEAAQTIDVTFEFHDPKTSDYGAVRALIQRDWEHVEQLADAVVEQPEIGTTVVSDGMDDPVGFATVLNLRTHAHLEAVSAFRSYVLKHCPKQFLQRLERLLNDPDKCVGWMLQERMLNTPAELVPELHDSLLQDIHWARENMSDKSFHFDNIILVSKCFYPSGRLAPAPGKKYKRKAERKQSVAHKDTKHAMFYKFEEEYYLQESDFHFGFDVPTPADDDGAGYAQSRIVMVLHRSKLPKIVTKLKALLRNAEKVSETMHHDDVKTVGAAQDDEKVDDSEED